MVLPQRSHIYTPHVYTPRKLLYPRKLCLWWVYCFQVVRACMRPSITFCYLNILKSHCLIFINQCYSQHALRPYIDCEINHTRHFIKIQFVNKGIEFINLPSIFKDKSVISSIPTYFENKESPIICYKYNKPIRSTVFNYNKLVTELDIENSIPDS